MSDATRKSGRYRIEAEIPPESEAVLAVDESSTHDVGVTNNNGCFKWISVSTDGVEKAAMEAERYAEYHCYFENPRAYQVVDLNTGEKHTIDCVR